MALTVSCIIPAYNEGPRIAAVLSVVCAHPMVDEVIVVDDASTDDTAAQVAHYDRVQLLRQPENRGKSAAIAAGLRASGGAVILFLDADLTELNADDLRALLRPVIHDRADATISLRGNAPVPWHWLGLDYLSGERAMRRALAPAPDILEQLPRFGMEVYMNRVWLNHGARLQVIAWPQVASPYKIAKRGFFPGMAADIAMIRDILSTIGAVTLIRQIWAMRGRRVAAPTRRRSGPTISTGAGR